MVKEVVDIKVQKEKALRISIEEGSAASFSDSISSSYITPFALALNAQPIHIGFLSSFYGILSPLSQWFGSKLIGKFHRKNIVLSFVLLQALTWIPLAILGFLFWKGAISTTLSLYILIIFFSLFAIFGGIHYPAWFSWMGDLVPEKIRGKYFSKRNIALGIVGIAAVLIGLGAINFFELRGKVMIGFAVLFLGAFIFRSISYLRLKSQYSPARFNINKRYHFSVTELLKKNHNFKKFAIYQAFFNFAVMVASPFFAVYMLDKSHLAFSYTTFILVSLSSIVFYLIFLPLVGKFSDKYGNLKLLYVANIFFALTPLIWIFTKSPWIIVLVPQLVSGLANAALVIAVTNFTYDSLAPKERGIGVAYVNILSGVGIFLGSILGGFLLNYGKIFSIDKFIFVFALAFILRALVAFVFLPMIKEEKVVKRLPPLHIHPLHPFKTINAEIGTLEHFVTRLYKKAPS